MNSVSLVGELVENPTLRRNRANIPECRMRIAVPRFARGGRREPGVVYVEASTFGREAIEYANRLERGSRIGISGRLDSDDDAVGVAIDQFVLL